MHALARMWSRIHLVHLHVVCLSVSRPCAAEGESCVSWTLHSWPADCCPSAFLESSTLTLGETTQAPNSFLSCLLLKEEWSWTYFYPTCKKLNFYSLWIFLWVICTHCGCSCFLVSTVSLYHLPSITLSVSICLCYTNYCTSQIPFASLPSLSSVYSPPSHSLQSHQHVFFQPFLPSSVFSHLFFTTPSFSFLSLFTHLSICYGTTVPLVFLSLSLGSIKVSAVPRRIMKTHCHLQWRNLVEDIREARKYQMEIEMWKKIKLLCYDHCEDLTRKVPVNWLIKKKDYSNVTTGW